MKTYLLDTSICVPLINRTDADLRSLLLSHSPQTVYLCSVVKAELHFGARNSDRVAENLDRIARFCSAFRSVPFDDEAASLYGSVRTQLQREGRPIGGNDMMIASIALAQGMSVVTRNAREFNRVLGLQVETW